MGSIKIITLKLNELIYDLMTQSTLTMNPHFLNKEEESGELHKHRNTD